MNICQTEKKQLGKIAEKEAKVIAGQHKIDEKQQQKQRQELKPLQDSKKKMRNSSRNRLEPEAISGQKK